ncbi:unnamed protein product [Lymnaea stagnalis]|uniref:Uncharacterized protein n=1 Tax=Lymnaea stagnalis TaxID=6523 RepID=A0AAV2HWM1_LYMST
MAASYANRQQKVSGRLGSQSQMMNTASQPNLTGTLNRTQVERRPAQFISASSKSRLDSDNTSIDGQESPGTLRRSRAKSQDRLNSSSGSLGGSRSNLLSSGQERQQPSSTKQLNPNLKPRPSLDDSRGNIVPNPQLQPNSPNYSNVQNYANNNNNYEKDIYSKTLPRDKRDSQPRGRDTQPRNRDTQPRDRDTQPRDRDTQPRDRDTQPRDRDSRERDTQPRERDSRDRDSQPRDRDSHSSHSSVTSQQSGAVTTPNLTRSTSNSSSTTSVVDSKFHEFEKVRVDYLRRGKLYEDTVFLPVNASAYFSREPPMALEWIRAKDIARTNRQAPKFIINDIERFDVVQGELGDCWLVAAMACLANPEHRNLFDRVVPPGQSFQENWYSGVFRFNFWHFGQWKQVLVDDLLPTSNGQLVFVHSLQSNEFWAALMEKAYAKLYGSYESLKGGQMMDSLTDLTGGVTEHYDIRGPLRDIPTNIVNILFKALDRMSLIGCSIEGSPQKDLGNGLIAAHSYSVTDLRHILAGQQPVILIRIRNPQGEGNEWRGRWSEWSQEWQQISPDNRAKLGLIVRDDGEFWMDFEDFLGNFDSLDICNVTPDAPLDVQKKWHTVEFHGRWIENFNAGGRPIKEDTHWSNPQYLMKLEDTDEDEDRVCSVVVQLMQKDRRRIKQKGEIFLYIGFSIYQKEKGYSLPLKKDFFDVHKEVYTSGAFLNVRQITKRFSLPPGEYILVPCTWEPNENADFYLRFFFEKGNIVEYCDDKPEKVDVQPLPVPPDGKAIEEAFKSYFHKVSGEDMEVDCFELREAINDSLKRDPLHRDISLEACKTFISLMDVDGSGRLGFVEFQFLWSHIRSWKKIFFQFDTDNSGLLDGRELRSALSGLGYKVTNKSLASLLFRFADQNGKINLDDFLILMGRLMKSFNSFHEYQKDGSATISLEQWLEKNLV